MSDFTLPQPNAENVELAAANRRLTTAILGMTLLTGLVACLSYLAGRTVTQIRSQQAAAVTTEIPPPPLVIHPTSKPSPVAAIAAPAPVPAPIATPAASHGLYLQVGLMNPSTDRSMQDRLEQNGFTVKLLPLENSPSSRVLVGPIQSSAQQRELETKLAANGFQFFTRRL
ncbi:MAG: hypothetical protein HYX27_04375 [Acidobacteria bacterium]|nr:hypothetical protein [Acidobacteriota bacterium]